MLKNLKESLESVFGYIADVDLSEGLLTLKIDGAEVVINESGELVGASRLRPARFDVDVNYPSPFVSTAGSAVEASV